MHNSQNYKYNTRQAQEGIIKFEGRPRLELTRDSFKWRAADQFNQLPVEIKNCIEVAAFKIKVKNWIKEHVPFS